MRGYQVTLVTTREWVEIEYHSVIFAFPLCQPFTYDVKIIEENYLDYIIIFVSIHIDPFGVKKVEESTHESIFNCGTQFEKTGSETFWDHFEASNEIF